MSDHVWIVTAALCKALNAWCREHGVDSRSWSFNGDEYRERGWRIAALEASGTSPDPLFLCMDATTYSVTACALGGVHRDCATCRGRR